MNEWVRGEMKTERMTLRFLIQITLRWESCRRSQLWEEDPKLGLRCPQGEIQEEPSSTWCDITHLINIRDRLESCQVYLTSKISHNTEMQMRIMMVIMRNTIQHQLTVTELLQCARHSQPRPCWEAVLGPVRYLEEADKGATPGFKLRSTQTLKVMLLTSKPQWHWNPEWGYQDL